MKNEGIKLKKYEKLFFCGIGKWDEETKRFLKENDIGGIILYPSLIEDYPSLVKFFAFIRREGKRLLISSDHEGGQLETVPFVPPFPGNLSLGRSETNFASEYAKMSGKILKAVGFNTVFAPVADLYTPKSSAVMGFRTFGSEPKRVAEYSLAMMEGYHAAGILPCAKHFPGHGKAFSDSHERLVTVNSPIEKLEREDFYPFKTIVENDAELLMTAHVVYSDVDKLPATLSVKILKKELREKMGYEGVILSDAMEMKAIFDNFSVGKIVDLFFNASGDMILLSDGIKNLPQFLHEIEKSVRNGRISEGILEASTFKVENLIEKYVSHESIGFVEEVMEKSLEWHKVKSLPNPKQVIFLLPQLGQMSQADVLPKHFNGIEKEVKKILHAEVVKYDPKDPNFEADDSAFIVDMVIDAYKSEKLLDFHRSLPQNTLYVIAHDPYDKVFFDDKNYVVTYSTTPITMAKVFNEIKSALSKREG